MQYFPDNNHGDHTSPLCFRTSPKIFCCGYTPRYISLIVAIGDKIGKGNMFCCGYTPHFPYLIVAMRDKRKKEKIAGKDKKTREKKEIPTKSSSGLYCLFDGSRIRGYNCFKPLNSMLDPRLRRVGKSQINPQGKLQTKIQIK